MHGFPRSNNRNGNRNRIVIAIAFVVTVIAVIINVIVLARASSITPLCKAEEQLYNRDFAVVLSVSIDDPLDQVYRK